MLKKTIILNLLGIKQLPINTIILALKLIYLKWFDVNTELHRRKS